MARSRGTRELQIKYDGAFFERDVKKTVEQNISALMESLAETGERDVTMQLKAGQSSRWPLGGGVRPGRVSGHVVGRVVSRTGKRWRATAKVSIRNEGFTPKQAVKLMAAASWLESTVHPFRRAAARIRRSARNAAKADLTRGLE